MGIRISKKTFLNFEKILHDMWNEEKSYSLTEETETLIERTGLSEKEIFYIWRHYGKLYVTHVEGYKDA